MEDTIVLYPSAGRAHLPPLLEIGKQILRHDHSSSTLSITVVISTPPFEDFFNDPYLEAISAIPSFSVLHLPTVSPTPIQYSPADVPALTFELTRLSNPHLHQTLESISKSKPIKALIIDFYCNLASEVSDNLGIPTYYFLPGGGSGLAIFLYLPTIHRTTTKSLKDINEFIHIPGLPPMQGYNLPSRMLDRSSKIYKYFLETATQMPKSAGIIVNTSETLEPRAIKAITEGLCTPEVSIPPVYCIGPLIAATADDDSEDKHECLTWLDSQPSKSILFLCFGSLTRLSGKQLKEIAIGLEMSGVGFLWVARPPSASDDHAVAKTEVQPSLDSYLPQGFLERTKERGRIVSWAPQLAVLGHDSVAGYVTHCGWNSVMEAITAGVPMLAWPRFADQKVNGALVVEIMKLGVAMTKSRDGFVSSQEFKTRVDEFMESIKGEEMRERLTAMRDCAVSARSEGGSSYVAMAKLVHSFIHG